MNKILIILLTLLISSQVFGQEKIYFDENWLETDAENADYYRIINPRGDLFFIQDFYISDSLQFEGLSSTPIDPLNLEGIVIWYYENGNISKTSNFQAGIPHGQLTQNFEDGSVQGIANYLKGEVDGLFTEYYSNGILMGTAIYKKGKLHGDYSRYYENGNIAEIATYKNDELNGTIINYNLDGSVSETSFYKNGKLIK